MKDKLKGIETIFLFGILFCTVLLLLQQFFYPGLLTRKHFLNWDAEHYFYIESKGYEGFRVAFFPFFPLLWRVLSVGIYGIVFVNAILYLGSFYFLMKSMALKRLETILYLSIPSSIFFFLPYSEALFFASATLLLLAVKSKRNLLVLSALLLCTLARPSFTVLLPALIIMEWLSEATIRKKASQIGLYILASGLGIVLVGVSQYYDTGQWFQFFSVQADWGNHLQVPSFPLRSWGGNMITRLDGVALLFGMGAGITLLLFLVKKEIRHKKKLSPEVLLSLAYLGGITLSVLLFRGGSLFSLNRFVFASPFILVAMNYYLKQSFQFSIKQLGIILFALVLYWLSFGSYVHIQAFLKFFAVSVYVLLFFGMKSNHEFLSKLSIIAFIILNFIFLITFYVHFLSTEGDVGFVG